MNKEIVISRNNVSISGNLNSDKVILFAHGYGYDLNMWRFVSPAFEQQYKIVLSAHIGSGQSDSEAYDALKYNTLGGYAQNSKALSAPKLANKLTIFWS